MQRNLIVRNLGLTDYSVTYEAMHHFTANRDDDTVDEIWLVEHLPVFTQGQAGKAEHVLNPGDIPIFQSDRGGQVTYHGPGQQMMYLLIDLRRHKLGVRELVTHIENTVINTLSRFGVASNARPDAPGVYVDGKKICSLGLRIRRGCSFHGLALNVDMDLTPFLRINPCGYAGMEMTQLARLNGPTELADVQPVLVDELVKLLDYQSIEWTTESN
ncbi:lipoyl(octanoyl) transferase LipB [Photobacterium sp. WH77]|uniref:Octanoyltransferase n=1 Tax=Photobacterium arenosum TaxID=2774143 RepID=A0ABR9BGP1_9GAMM|nr:lipoyl(octanoyl) transferase LipB [Photobacterium sp. 2_MG-2023]MBD8511711.1 lipoyl(octanoyl) transferase LipB [Photobacterium arenosum]MBV7261585.1 lipoyl(octanoyl) transferase LipB [Photobacterium sp. WH24]MCG2836785.1 lipoyl(octanoyl) transferase LipB [Photobacterium sp. WH77]MCG2844606.1 lipoyl(octanoyl) transferase LipB [Photobacterium sp. WH80]MDO6583562.1 lipoyl(octanoyl) transferase LipB [Photobacterium sp. 2_MG-2023]